jgi:hypothetical protein
MADPAWEEAVERASAARVAHLRSWGGEFVNGEDVVFAPIVGARLTGGPTWPSREGFRALRTERTTIVATEGLSDPYEAAEAVPELASVSGTGMEIWLEADERIEDIPSSWAFAVVSAVSAHVAAHRLTRALLDEIGVVVVELFADECHVDPARAADRITPRGTIGVLVGLRPQERPDVVPIPPTDVRYVNARLLLAEQVERSMKGGAKARELLATKLGQTPSGWVSRMPRVAAPPPDDRPWWQKMFG